MNPFNWLRTMAKTAVVNGVHDGLFEVTPEGQDPPADLVALRERLSAAVALPALAEHVEPKKVRVGK